jgi:hypothetical protein
MSERFEIRLTPERRQELSELALLLGVSAADAARLAISRLINGRDELLQLPPDGARDGRV